jgi:carbon monoxide dehydrogenase subunit G
LATGTDRKDETYKERSMRICYEHQETVGTTPERAFAAIDDLSLTSRWLPPCVSLEKIGDGPNAAGDKLRYVFTQGGRQSEMEGEIIARQPGQRLYCKYFDRMFEVSVDLRVAAAPGGTLTTHIIQITPLTFLGKLMSPLIRLGLDKQTRTAAANLKKLLESRSD